LLAAGAMLGAAGIIFVTEANRITASDQFCTSCHSMAAVAADAHYQASGHQRNGVGVRVGCADCHAPPTNWFVATFDHIRLAVRDVLAESTHNYADAALWEKRRKELAAVASEEMRRNDSANCRRCHDVSAMQPKSDAVRLAHAMIAPAHRACLDCHAGLVHAR
jgi:nitrate/TMAO reductase-like tetraheme cytochrome c subunit